MIGWTAFCRIDPLELHRVSSYMPLMLSLFLIWLLTVAAMEGFAYVMHRWVMHGPGWFLHESHHRVRHGRFELNDLYAVIFAIPSIVLIYGGVQAGWGALGDRGRRGIAGLWRDLFRLPRRHRPPPDRIVTSPSRAYMKRIVQAHRLHHAIESKHTAQLRLPRGAADRGSEGPARSSRAKLRAPTGRETPLRG